MTPKELSDQEDMGPAGNGAGGIKWARAQCNARKAEREGPHNRMLTEMRQVEKGKPDLLSMRAATEKRRSVISRWSIRSVESLGTTNITEKSRVQMMATQCRKL